MSQEPIQTVSICFGTGAKRRSDSPRFEVPTFMSVMVVILSVTAYVGAKPVVEKAQKYVAW